jgi:phosphoribosylanthranilate isomerase
VGVGQRPFRRRGCQRRSILVKVGAQARWQLGRLAPHYHEGGKTYVATLSGSHPGPNRQPADVGHATRVKVCGIVEPAEIDVLAAQRVDWVGLWLAVPGGPHDLPAERWRSLAERAAGVDDGPAPVLVTFTKDAELLREALTGAPVEWVQLHGYPTPGVVRKVKAIGPDVKVIKVLHVRGGECVEASLIGSYEKAGVDVFLFDTVSEDGRVGSTGLSLDADVVAGLVDRLTKPFLLAGGISDDNRARYEQLTQHPLFLGIDVDTNARGQDGRIASERVDAITRAWRTEAGANA